MLKRASMVNGPARNEKRRVEPFGQALRTRRGHAEFPPGAGSPRVDQLLAEHVGLIGERSVVGDGQERQTAEA